VYYSLLSKNQIDNIYKNRSRQIGKYLAIWAESSHLNKFMITLSPNTNTLDATIELRKEFFSKLNNIKHYHQFEVAYFSAIEIGLNKNPISGSSEISQQQNIKSEQKNFHIHIQLFTNMKKDMLITIINRINPNLFTYSHITSAKQKNVKYDYVIKDLKTVDWKLQYILKTQYKNKIIYTSSRKELGNFIITKVWSFMKLTYKDKWTKIKDKYSYMLGLKKQGDMILSNNNLSTISSLLNGNSNSTNIIHSFDLIYIKKQGIYIYIKKNIL
jgi:hypothetical protein